MLAIPQALQPHSAFVRHFVATMEKRTDTVYIFHVLVSVTRNTPEFEATAIKRALHRNLTWHAVRQALTDFDAHADTSGCRVLVDVRVVEAKKPCPS